MDTSQRGRCVVCYASAHTALERLCRAERQIGVFCKCKGAMPGAFLLPNAAQTRCCGLFWSTGSLCVPAGAAGRVHRFWVALWPRIGILCLLLGMMVLCLVLL